jgi:hypothetical protein
LLFVVEADRAGLIGVGDLGWGERPLARTGISAIALDLDTRSASIAPSDIAKSPDAFNASGLFGFGYAFTFTIALAIS